MCVRVCAGSRVQACAHMCACVGGRCVQACVWVCACGATCAGVCARVRVRVRGRCVRGRCVGGGPWLPSGQASVPPQHTGVWGEESLTRPAELGGTCPRCGGSRSACVDTVFLEDVSLIRYSKTPHV